MRIRPAQRLTAAARANVETYAEGADRWTIKVRNACEGFDETEVDRIVADMPEPQELLDPVAKALVPGGLFTSYVPTVLQLKSIRDGLTAHPAFGFAETFEILERTWYADERSLRPDHRMVAHTGFITVARRLAVQ